MRAPQPDLPVEPGGINEELVRLARAFAEKTVAQRKLKEEEKALGRELAILSTQITELVEISDLEPPFRLQGLGTVSLRTDFSVKQYDKNALLQSLEALGHDDCITTSVNAQKLGSLIRDLAEANKQFPEGIEVAPYQKATFTKERAKKA